MSRKLARESVYKLVFEYLFIGEYDKTTEELFKQDSDFSDDDKEYLSKVYQGVIANFDDLKTYVKDKAQGYSLDRIYKADLSALLLATYEMKYLDDVPPKVSIAEAVALVKKYSTDKSNSYVNGILASIYKDLVGEENTNADN